MVRHFVAVLLIACSAYAGDPAQVWRTIETDHFHIHFYTLPHGGGEEKVAQRLAVVAEDARKRLLPYLGPGLKRKTHIVVTDNTDDYNGFAGVYPYPSITILATSPDDRAELNDYDEWLSGLVMHEYTHILHTGTISGPCAWIVNALLGWGIGIVYAPNQAQPRFILEGLAVFEESERTSGGRLRNSIWDMYLRAAALEGKMERIDQFTHIPIQFPQANSHYLYGSALMRYVAATYGQDKLMAMSREYGSVCVPGGISRTIRHYTGKTWMELYDDYRADATRRYGAQRDAIRQRGETPSLRLTDARPQVGRPAWTPDGKILFLDNDGYRRQSFSRIDPDTRKMVSELKVDIAGGINLSPDGSRFVYHAEDFWRTNYLFYDVYSWDRVNRVNRRLTWGRRATNPALSPDGNAVVFEVNDSSSRGLGMVKLDHCAGEDDCPVEMLIPADGFEQTYTPAFSPDGKTLAFSWWKMGGWRDIWLLDMQTRALTRITADRSLDLEPRFSPDGKYLYFVSDRTSVYNLYAYELATKKLWMATNVVNGVFDPAISPDGKKLAFVGFQAAGYDLEVADLDPAKWREADPPLLDRPPAQLAPAEPWRKSKRYNPFPTVLPWVYRPYFIPDSYGELIGVQLSGNDASERHYWSLTLAFGTGRVDDIAFGFNYGYSGLWPQMSLGVGHSLSRRGGLIINGTDIGYDEDSWSVGTSIGLPLIRRINEYSDLYFSYSLSYLRNISRVPEPDPSATLPVFPETGRIAGLGMTFSYNNIRRYLYSVSEESGRAVSLSLGIGARVFGSNHDVWGLSWRWAEFIPMPWQRPRWLRSHVLALSYAGGVSGGDLRHRGLYFLGGYPPQDLLRSIYDFSRPGGASLRGYPYAAFIGDQFHVFNFEYRFPIVWIERGFQTFPLYFQRLHGKLFADWGGAFFGDIGLDKFKLGIGGELMLELTYLWYFPAALQLGYAHGYGEKGSDQVYFLLNGPF
jgi:WD40-like Beta Propeller Repeat